MKTKISVIGGSGFIGTNICTKLNDHNIDFEILDLKISKRFPNYSKIVDIQDKQALMSSLSGSIVIHLAAVHRDDIEEKIKYHDVNVNGTKNIIDVCTDKKINKIIFTSSVAVYGFSDDSLNEDAKINPLNEYGKTKYEAELILNKWYEDSEKNELFIIRPTVVFGTGNRGNFYNLLNQIAIGKFVMIGNGRNIKSIAYIDNLVDFLYVCILSKKSFGLYNYVDTPNLDMNQMIKIIRGSFSLKNKFNIKIPYSLALAIGYFADLIRYLFKIKLTISSIRIRKFCANTRFSSSKNKLDNFSATFPLDKAIDITIKNEFIEQDKDYEIFYTE
jgi:nucleoside-diphosphate-sugar epimerase